MLSETDEQMLTRAKIDVILYDHSGKPVVLITRMYNRLGNELWNRLQISNKNLEMLQYDYSNAIRFCAVR